MRNHYCPVKFLLTPIRRVLRHPRQEKLPLRRIGSRDPVTGNALVFLTNNFTVPALTIAVYLLVAIPK